jgi:hypothetical protein
LHDDLLRKSLRGDLLGDHLRKLDLHAPACL